MSARSRHPEAGADPEAGAGGGDEWGERLDRFDRYFVAAERALVLAFVAAFAGLLFYNLVLQPLRGGPLHAPEGWSPWRPAFQS